jgi:hypothetical protein
MSINTCKLIENYLIQRTQCTVLNGIRSGQQQITTGVPQGSTLGPLLFLVFINDFPQISNEAKYTFFADDATLTVHHKDPVLVKLKLDYILPEVNVWCTENKLTLNVNKTEYVVFGTRTKINKTGAFTLEIGTDALNRVEKYKYLGTTLDACLTIMPHISRLNQQMAAKLNTFRKIRHCISEKTAILLYKATLLPILDYNDIIYGLATVQQTIKIQRIQNRALRIVFKGKKHNTAEMHKTANIDLLKDRRETHMLKLMFDRTKRPQYTETPLRATRQGAATLLKGPVPKTNKLKKAPCYSGSILWNKQSPVIRRAVSKT